MDFLTLVNIGTSDILKFAPVHASASSSITNMESFALAQITGQHSSPVALGASLTDSFAFSLLGGVSANVLFEKGSSVLSFSSLELVDSMVTGQPKKATFACFASCHNSKKGVLPKNSSSPYCEVFGPALGPLEKLDCAPSFDEAVCGLLSSPFLDKGKKPMVDVGKQLSFDCSLRAQTTL